MFLQQVLRWLVIAIVLIVAFSMMGFVLKIGAVLFGLALRILLLLLIVAIILRFVTVLQTKRRWR
jgi:hypothetical protein